MSRRAEGSSYRQDCPSHSLRIPPFALGGGPASGTPPPHPPLRVPRARPPPATAVTGMPPSGGPHSIRCVPRAREGRPHDPARAGGHGRRRLRLRLSAGRRPHHARPPRQRRSGRPAARPVQPLRPRRPPGGPRGRLRLRQRRRPLLGGPAGPLRGAAAAAGARGRTGLLRAAVRRRVDRQLRLPRQPRHRHRRPDLADRPARMARHPDRPGPGDRRADDRRRPGRPVRLHRPGRSAPGAGAPGRAGPRTDGTGRTRRRTAGAGPGGARAAGLLRTAPDLGRRLPPGRARPGLPAAVRAARPARPRALPVPQGRPGLDARPGERPRRRPRTGRGRHPAARGPPGR